MNQDELSRAAITAWYAIALEHDKLLFQLSAAGIALVLCLVTQDVEITAVTRIFYGTALANFLLVVLAMSVIFSQNRLMIEQKLAGQEQVGKLLSILDFAAVLAFSVGAVCVVAIGVLALR